MLKKYVFCLASSLLSYFLALNPLIQALLILMVMDIISGFAANWGQLTSGRAFRGLAQKSGVLFVVSVGWIFEHYMQLPVGRFVTGFFVSYEAISVLENARKMGVPLPQKLIAGIKTLSEEQNEEKN